MFILSGYLCIWTPCRSFRYGVSSPEIPSSPLLTRRLRIKMAAVGKRGSTKGRNAACLLYYVRVRSTDFIVPKVIKANIFFFFPGVSGMNPLPFFFPLMAHEREREMHVCHKDKYKVIKSRPTKLDLIQLNIISKWNFISNFHSKAILPRGLGLGIIGESNFLLLSSAGKALLLLLFRRPSGHN